MYIGTPLSRVPAAPIHLCAHDSSVGKSHGRCRSDDRRAAVCPDPQSKQGAGLRADVAEQQRILPLVTDHVVKTAVAVYVRDGNGSGNVGIGNADLARQVVVAPVRGAYIQWIVPV